MKEGPACNAIVKSFHWVGFSRNVSCLFSRRGSVTKTTLRRKAFLRAGALFTLLISGKVIWEEGGSSKSLFTMLETHIPSVYTNKKENGSVV